MNQKSRFKCRKSDDGKFVEIDMWYADRVKEPFTQEQILQQIHIANPKVRLNEVEFIPGICFITIKVPIAKS